MGSEPVDAWVMPNSGIVVNASSIHYIGASNQGAVYQAANLGTVIGTDGIVLTTGSANFPTSNTSSGYTNLTGSGSSVEISSLSKQWSYDNDEPSFEFTVAPGVDAVTTKVVFASEEYPEWVGIFTAPLAATGLPDLGRSTHFVRAVISDTRDAPWDSAVFLSELRGLTGTQPPATVPLPAPVLLLGSILTGILLRARPSARA